MVALSLQVTLLAIGAYLLGSIPTAYIAGRVLKGIDVRSYGSGSVSGSNVWHSVARWAVFPVGIADVLKGLIPLAIAYYVLNFPIWGQGVVGLAAIAGHSWSVFLRFSGGRGIATLFGVLALLAPRELLVFIGVWLIVLAIFNSPIGALIAQISLPIASWGFGEELSLTLMLVAMALLLIAKRLMGNQGIFALISDWRHVAINRLLFDRDIRDREAWVRRAPNEGEGQPKGRLHRTEKDATENGK